MINNYEIINTSRYDTRTGLEIPVKVIRLENNLIISTGPSSPGESCITYETDVFGGHFKFHWKRNGDLTGIYKKT